MRVKLTAPLKPGFAKLIDMFPENESPFPEKVAKYYGEKAPSKAFTALKHSRLIFLRENTANSYVVMPDIPRNKHMWREMAPLRQQQQEKKC